MNMNVDMRNKTVLVTGGTRGIGREIANIFAKNGANVIVNGTNEELGAKAVAEITAMGARAIFAKADVGNLDDVNKMVEKGIKEFGKIDILINNAGINIDVKDRQPIHLFPDDKWKKILNVDLDGVYYCSKAVIKEMVKSGGGRVVNISSVVGLVPLRLQSAFAAAKAAVINLTKSMACELAPENITVNVILPGSIMIDRMFEAGMYKDGRMESIMSHIPMHRPGKPEDIGYAALFIASDQANYITGSVLTVDGGWTCGFMRDW
jgi:3-oxoacyl-[acyl-carrier protein] reductase